MGGFASSRILEVHGERMIKRTFDPGFRIELHQKDLNLALSTGARTLGVSLPNTATAQELFNACAAHGGSGVGPLGDGARARDAGEFRDRAEAGKSLTSSERSGHVLRAQLLRRMFDAAVDAAQPDACLPPHLPAPPQGPHDRRSAPARRRPRWRRRSRTIGPGPLSGLVVTRYGYAVPCERIEIVEAAHPVPDAAGLSRGAAHARRSSGLTADDLVHLPDLRRRLGAAVAARGRA